MPPTQYLPALSDQLAQNNLNTLRSILAQINTTEAGAAFLSSLYSDQGFTVYAPTDQAFEGYAYNPSNVNVQNPFYLQDVLKYHIVPALVQDPLIAPPRSHTILHTLFHNTTAQPSSLDTAFDLIYGNLPGEQTQVLVLESTPGDNGGAFIRGDSWNVSTVGQAVQWQNLIIQKVDGIIPFPSPFLTTLTEPLIQNSPSGLIIARSLFTQLDLGQTINNSTGITAFLPVDESFDDVAAALASNGKDMQRNLVLNHVVNGSVIYSSTLGNQSLTTAVGESLEFITNLTGSYVRSGNLTARVLRSDVCTSNGVIHVIDTFLQNPDSNAASASSAYSSALGQATRTGVTEAIITPSSIPTGSTSPTGGASRLQTKTVEAILGLAMVVMFIY